MKVQSSQLTSSTLKFNNQTHTSNKQHVYQNLNSCIGKRGTTFHQFVYQQGTGRDIPKLLQYLENKHSMSSRRDFFLFRKLIGKHLWKEVMRVELPKSDLSEINFDKNSPTYLRNLELADLEAAMLCGANLQDVNLSGANLYNAKLGNCCLYGTNLTGACLVNVNDEAIGDILVDNQTRFRGADLTGAQLIIRPQNNSGNTNQRTDFSKTNLTLAKLIFTNNPGPMSFVGANLEHTVIGIEDINYLQGSDFSSAELNGTMIKIGDQTQRLLTKEDLQEANCKFNNTDFPCPLDTSEYETLLRKSRQYTQLKQAFIKVI